MYESLLEWCRFPVTIHQQTGFDKAGDTTYTSSSENGYIVDEIKRIIDKTGKEYLSYSHVYFPAHVNVGENDMLEFPSDAGRKREIYKKSTFYDGTLGEASIHVVYL